MRLSDHAKRSVVPSGHETIPVKRRWTQQATGGEWHNRLRETDEENGRTDDRDASQVGTNCTKAWLEWEKRPRSKIQTADYEDEHCRGNRRTVTTTCQKRALRTHNRTGHPAPSIPGVKSA